MVRPRMRIRALLPLALVVGGVSGLLAWAGGGFPARALAAAALLWDIADGPGGTGGPGRCVEPAVGSLPVPLGAGIMPADRYGCGDDAGGAGGAGLVLLPGLTAQGKDDPALTDFARVLARAGFVVLVPDLPGRRSLAVGTADIPAIQAAVAVLGKDRGGRRVGLAAISFAAGPALLAAATPSGRDRLGLLLVIGGYHDLPDMVAWVTTGHRRDADGAWVRGTPPDLAVWALLYGNLHLLDDPNDRALLREVARLRWTDGSVPVGDLTARLGPQGRAVWSLMENRDPDRVRPLMALLPERLRGELAALDLAARGLHGLTTPIMLIHGKDDPVIPWRESLALQAAAPDGLATLFAVARLGHTGDHGLDPAELPTLWRTAVTLLKHRDRLAGGDSIP